MLEVGTDVNECPNHLPANLLRLRQARGLTQAALGKLAGLTPSLISKIERGTGSNVRAITILALARGLGVNPCDLLAEPPMVITLPSVVTQ